MISAFSEDCHWLPQWMYVEGECHHRMRTESLGDDFRMLVSSRMSIKPVPRLPVSMFQGRCNFDASMFDRKSEILLREMYAKDFALY